MRDGWRIIMIKKTETIQVRLTNYGTIEVVSIPTRIYKDSYNVMRLSCMVPKVEETGARICKVYATDVDEAGNTIFTSQAHFLPQLREKDGSEKIIKINGFDYIIYEDRLPEEFCKDTGNITLNFAEGIIDGENEIVRNNVSGQLNLFISGDGYNYNGVKISNYDVVASRIDAIYKTSENALKVAEEAKDAVVQGEGTKVTLNGELLPIWSADFVESEKQKSVTDGAIVHKNEEPIVFAESERQKSETDGAIVHEKDVADVEHVELLYDKNSTDANINKGQTSGVMFDGNTTPSVFLGSDSYQKYKGFYVYVDMYGSYGKVFVPNLSFSNSTTRVRTSFCLINNAVSSGIVLFGNLKYENNSIYSGSLRRYTLETSTVTLISLDEKYNFYKIEGVLR